MRPTTPRSHRTYFRALSRPALTAALLLLLVCHNRARADFTTIINVPPDIGNNQSIGSNTQLNITGGSIGSNFDAGASNGTSVNVEVNISGGTVGTTFEAYAGSVVNVSGGVVNSSFDAKNGSLVNISGGLIGAGFDALSGSVVNFSGGAIADDFDASKLSIIRIIGNDFRLNGCAHRRLGYDWQ